MGGVRYPRTQGFGRSRSWSGTEPKPGRYLPEPGREAAI